MYFSIRKISATFRHNLFRMTAYQIIALIAVLSISSFAIVKLPIFKRTGLSCKWRLMLWGAKLLASIAVLLLYTEYYPKETADIYKYYKDGQTLYQASPDFSTYAKTICGIGMQDPKVQALTDSTSHWNRKYLKGVWNDNRSIIRVNAILYPISGGFLLTHSIVFAFLAFFGLSLLLIGIQRFAKPKLWLAFAVFLIPNLFLWSSGMLKESLLILNLGILFYAVSKLYDKITIKGLLIFLLGVFLFITTKIYVLICMLPALCFLLFAKNRKHRLRFFIVSQIAAVFLIIGLSYVTEKANLLHVMDRKQQDFINMVEQSEDVGSDVEVPNVDASFLSIISKAPQGFIHSMFRPHPLEWNSPVKLLAGMENIILLLLLIFAIIKMGKPTKDQMNFLLFTLSFVIIFYTIIGLSTPVLGALVRYKIPALPFIGASIVLLLETNQKLKLKLK